MARRRRSSENRNDLIGSLIVGVIGIVIISQVKADTTIAASLGTLETLIIGFVTVGLAVGLLIKAFRSTAG